MKFSLKPRWLVWLLTRRPEPDDNREDGKLSKRTESLLLAHAMARSHRKGAAR